MGKKEEDEVMDILSRAVLECQKTNYSPSYKELCQSNEEFRREHPDIFCDFPKVLR